MLWLKSIHASERRPRQQAITWANVDPDICHYMVSPGHNELNMRIDFYKFQHQCFIQWIGANFAILPMQANVA